MSTLTTPTTWTFEAFTAAVGDAVQAPSIHNSQPWRFRWTSDGAYVLLDERRRLAVCDADGRMARISCGAAAYNLRLGLAVSGLPARHRLVSGGALLYLWPAQPRPPTPMERRLHWQISRRHTNRGPFADTPVGPGLPQQLADAARREGGWLDFVAGERALTTLAELIRIADAELRANSAYAAELRAWTICANHAVEGIGPDACGAAPHPAEIMTRRDYGGPGRGVTRDLSRHPAVAVLGALGDGPDEAIRVGMALQCVLLTAADLGLATAMYSQPIEVPATREQIRRAIDRIHDPHLVLRFGYAPTTCYTNRRPVTDVIDA
ncbi:Acg family FMN-binding oxidoreductase [Dactylosporangium sp. CA-139114]|uniref:Acg family FMN-binding oxidoreductase n=1 Tax=Dactylosporangium sp. CA-139114 TaxID=3239931 RepID=UPI003D991553